MIDSSHDAPPGLPAAPRPAYSVMARYYDMQHQDFTPDIGLYLDLAARLGADGGARVLEVGCGTGRVLLPLVQAGHTVVGLDTSPEMLDIARRQLAGLEGARGRLVLGDATRAPLAGRFDLAIIALNTFLHNDSRDSQLAMLANARRTLRPGGVLVVDLPPNDEMTYQPDSGEFEFEASLVDPRSGATIDKYVASSLAWASQEQVLRYRYEEHTADGATRIEVTGFRLRHVFKHEMELLLLHAGFTDWQWHGDYDLSDYGEGSPRMIVFAR